MKHTDSEKKIKILWALLGILVLILLITMIILIGLEKDGESSKNKKNESTGEQISSTEVIGIYSTEGSEADIVKEGSESKIQQLIENYYAAKLAGDMDMLGLYVDDMSNIKKEDIEKPNKYIEDYRDIECYAVSGSKSSSVTVLVKLKYKYYGIDTPAPVIVYIQTVYNEKEDKYYVHNMTTADEVNMYITSVAAKESIKDMEAEVESEFKAACDSDEDLQSLYEIMH